MRETIKTYSETVTEILSRFSVTDLIEQTDEDLARADELFYKASVAPKIVGQGELNLIQWWRVQSGEKIYEVRRFRNFLYCSCESFFYKKKCCKHAALTAGVYCQNCRVSAAKVGKLCYDCDVNKMRFQIKTENNDESSNSKN